MFSIAFVFVPHSASAQTSSDAIWYSGTGTATGKNMEKIRVEALNRARKDALEKAGIDVSAATLSVKSEASNKLVDFFSEFAESNTRGLILSERDVRFERPVPLDSTYTVYSETAHIEALVATPRGQPDPAFEVTLASSRNAYEQHEPITLKIRSTEPGYLTILDIHEDSINVLFPNVIDRDNHIYADTDFVFPPSKAYSLELETLKGESSSADIFIAVVTKDNIPFPNIAKIGLDGSRLLVAEKGLTTYANWLYKIPLDRRAAASKLIEVQKSN